MADRSRSRGRDDKRDRARDDRARADRGTEGRLREDERGGLFRAGRGGAGPVSVGRGRDSGGSIMSDPRGPPPDVRGFDPRGDTRGFGRGGGGGYQRGGRPFEVRGPPGPPGLALMGPPRGAPDDRSQPVDREKQCPMLIRIFCKFGEHHRDEQFSYSEQPVQDEVLVHTWRDATLGELTELLAQEHREVRHSGTKCTFKVVFPNGEGKYISRHLGSTAIGRRLSDDISSQTLAQIRFQVGDFVSVAIIPARSAGGGARGDEKDRIRSEATKREGDGEEDDKDKEKSNDKEDAGRDADKVKPAEEEKVQDAQDVKDE